MTRGVRTDSEMLASGQWVRVARRHYRHVAGVEIVYDNNRWLWYVRGGASDGEGYATLEAARYYAERSASN